MLWFILVFRVPTVKREHHSGLASRADLSPGGRIENNCLRRKIQGVSLDVNNLQMLDEKRDIFYLLSFILQNTKPVGHQVYLVMIILQTKLFWCLHYLRTDFPLSFIMVTAGSCWFSDLNVASRRF